ncbi:MAG: tRNA 5-methylaminomethyl-2-thiouridine biosynthesis bifunctional protein [Pseudohongiellaceae bacterium]|jgi:tRNA 5-methylaminomethyl-2-thiouridine biosynthesis bifunctional protein
MINPAPPDKGLLPTLRIDLAKIEWDASNSPRAKDFDDVYFSTSGAEAETEHVFLAANNLANRWAQLKQSHQPFTIAEIGFGSGLNFAKTLQLWESTDEKPLKLHYIAFEKHPLSAEDMHRAHANWPHLQPYFDQLLKNYHPFSRVCYRIAVAQDITLDLHFGDALSRLRTLYLPANAAVDCWYLDGFSPRQNTALWSEELCSELARLCKHNGTLSTYSAAGWVRNNLTNAGFDVKKTAGFAGKRHMLSATIETALLGAKPPLAMASWSVSPAPNKPAKSAIVIGAGLAGSSVANALALRGLQVTILDSNATPASGASGINQLALRPRLFKESSATAEFYLQAYLFAQDQYRAMQTKDSHFWQQCGVLQSINAQNKKHPLCAAQLALTYGSEIVQAVDSEQALALAGLRVVGDYIYFHKAGWIDPQALCAAYLAHPNITAHFGIQIDSIENSGSQWLSKAHGPGTVHRSDIVVLANGVHAKGFSQTHDLPLDAVRGQATYIAASPTSEPLATVVMAERSIFPSFNLSHTVAASYRRESSLAHSLEDDLDNLAGKRHLFGENLDIDNKVLGSKVALRCNSRDFLPIVGMIADTEKTQVAFAGLKRNARAVVTGDGYYHQGLYITAGHGSNGAATCPLAAEHIASLVSGQASALNAQMIAALSPARFLVRDLKKQV